MTAPNPTRYDISASAIAAWKACPTKFRLAYREGLRPAEDAESLRIGTNWHEMHEVYYVWGGNLQRVIDLLNERYKNPPASITADAWALERQILITCFIGYLWYWQNDPVEVLASEVPFELPLHEPRTGMPLPLTEVRRVGKIDHMIRWHGMVGALERKSTSRGIAPTDDYWDKARKDTQVSMYALAMRDMGVRDARAGETYGSTLYDVWRRPTIKPAMLTQGETREFAWGAMKGQYHGQIFHIETIAQDDTPDLTARVIVNGVQAEVKVGKTGFAIRETIEMYGARLLADIQARPEFYFQRREIARTDADLQMFRRQLFAIYQTQKLVAKQGLWYEDETSCNDPVACAYKAICYGPGSDAVCDGSTTPAGFKRIFVDLTVNGKESE